jgi:NitT/TauT family transport system substrate-binding protein
MMQDESYWQRFYGNRISRRRALAATGGLIAGLGGLALAGCGDEDSPQLTPTPEPPPETTAIRLSLAVCDAPFMICEPYLREEGFTDIQLTAGAAVAQITEGRSDIATGLFVTDLAAAIEAGSPIVAIGSVHPGCSEMWASPSVATLKDLRGHTVVVRAKSANFLPYTYMAIALKNAGVDPSEVNFVVKSDADLTRQFLDGRSDLLFLATTAAVAFRTNPENKGHLVLDQAMEAPWSEQQCCVVTTSRDWLQANPIAAKRALRAVYRASDSLPKDRLEAAKLVTDKGMFMGPANVELVRGAVNMVDYEWRKHDLAESLRFHGRLMNQVDLLKLTPEETIAKGTDLRFTKDLVAELKR